MYAKRRAVPEKSTRFLFGIRRCIHDSSAPQNWPCSEGAFRKIGELVRKKPAHSSLRRRQHLQFLLVQRSEIHRNQYCAQFSAAGKRVWQSSALVSPTKNSEDGSGPIGDDVEPIEAHREDVEMGNGEDAGPLEAGVPRTRKNLKNPTSREKQEPEVSGHTVYRNWCAACVEGRGIGEQHRIELLEDEERETTIPIVAFDQGSMAPDSMETMQRTMTFDSALENTCSLVSSVSHELMDRCEVERNRISLADVGTLGEAHLKCCMQMYCALALITKGSVRTLYRSVEETNGAEAWRLIHSRYAPDTRNRQT